MQTAFEVRSDFSTKGLSGKSICLIEGIASDTLSSAVVQRLD
jgi:hypothetical protein